MLSEKRSSWELFWKFSVILAVVATVIVTVLFLIRPPEDDCPGGNALPPVCIKDTLVAGCVEIGDVNADGQVNLGDLVILVRMVLGIICPDNWIYGNMNGDEQLNAADILLLQKVVLQL